MRIHRKHAEWVVGLFALAALALVVGFVGVVGWGEGWFQRRALFHARFDASGGLKPGAEVLVGGLSAGRVTHVELEPDGRIAVTLRVSRDFTRFIRTDSVARIEATTLVSSPAVYVTVGSPEKPDLAEGKFIRTVNPQRLGNVDLMSLLHNLDELARMALDPEGPLARIVGRLDRVAARLEDPEAGLDRTLARLDRVATLAESVLSRADRILAASDEAFPIVADLAPHLNDKLDRVMAALQRVDKLLAQAQKPDTTLGALLSDRSLYDSLLALLRDTRRLVTAVLSTSEGLAKVTPELPGLIDEASYQLDEVDRLLETLKRHPLLGGGTDDEKPEPVEPLHGAESPYRE